jgi:quercetin dioxygenase-like cupin family protein
MLRIFTFSLLAIALAGSAALAQGPASAPASAPTLRATPFEPFKYMPAKDVDALTHKPDGKVGSAVVSDHEYYYVEYVTRADTGNNPEAHGHWYDYIHVLGGEGTITYGGTQPGARDVGQAEMRGGTLVGAQTITLHPGDYLVIPPGLPHLFTATPGNKFTYLIFKQRV